MTLKWLLKVQPHLDNFNPNLRHSFGVDFARTGDLSVFTACACQTDTARHIELTLETATAHMTNKSKLCCLFC